MQKNLPRKNKLTAETSPYLAQHAGNPVAWQPWSDAAFETARRCDVPVFLSIGYSTCHWCHVMAHESFEDEEIARLLNGNFVCIKVDREERPDIDSVYMRFCQALTGSGGWPLTIVMTPDKQPFFAATYIPPRTRNGKTGMRELLPRITSAWQARKHEIISGARDIMEELRRSQHRPMHTEPCADLNEQAFSVLQNAFDKENGGFGHAPKFPSPHTLLFLLRYWKRTGMQPALDMTTATLKALQRGGIHDHVGFGFHRYSTDPFWFLPHFEKMLYDQAMLLWAYTEAFQATGLEECSRTACDIAAFVLNDLRSPEGGFYCALDADSQGGEGAFYQWTFDELQILLAPDELRLAEKLCGARRQGNARDEATGVPTGKNILYLAQSPKRYAHQHGLELQEVAACFERMRCKLQEARSRRKPPARDEKILADWNALMIGSLARAGRALAEQSFIDAAAAAADYILSRLYAPEQGLLHCRSGNAAVTAQSADYSFTIWALMELYQAVFDEAYLLRAISLQRELDERYSDERTGAFFTTPADAADLPLRPLDVYDSALPSANSLAVLNLQRLADITGRVAYTRRARRICDAFADRLQRMPEAYCMLMCALEYERSERSTITIAGTPGAADTQALIAAVNRLYLPDAFVLLHDRNGPANGLAEHMPGAMLKPPLGNRATAYLCRAGTCQAPVTSAAKLERLLRS